MRTAQRTGPLLVACALATAGACRDAPDTVLVVQVRSSDDLPTVDALDVTLRAHDGADGGAITSSSRRIRGGAAGIVLPQSFSAQLPRSVTGPLDITIVALDSRSLAVARGGMGPFPITVGHRLSFVVELSCIGPACGKHTGSDGGTSDGMSDAPAGACGDGLLGAGETCDVAIATGAPGACPATCDDHVPCTRDELAGGDCQASCNNVEITEAGAVDHCCPGGATSSTDPDCSATCGNQTVDPGETCDTKIPFGNSGACPAAGDCDDGDACSLDRLISGGTCNAICVHQPITKLGTADGCCPAGAPPGTDPDCPASCGDGVVNGQETCDVAIPGGKSGACAGSCERPGPCATAVRYGSGCSAVCVVEPITRAAGGDGCCPPGASASVDSDCALDGGVPDAGTGDGGAVAPLCGDGVVQAPEWCEPGLASAPCPASCAPGRGCVSWALQASAGACTAHCALTAATTCSSGDGCCPPGCAPGSDTDCVVCGDGQLSAGERCDRGITAGHSGACPASCDDLDACTVDIASGSVASCSRHCSHVPVKACASGDGCCPAGCHAGTDADCAPSCGNGRLEQGEFCDPLSTCPTGCPDDGDRCTTEILLGSASACSARCAHQPIMGCSGPQSDGCCPTGCNVYADVDCT